jgi:hypothetical protein
MCRQLILLAENDFRQMIFTCEHRTIHITHQQTTICLSHGDFVRFTAWLLEDNLFITSQTGNWHIRETNDGLIELWLGSGGLRMRDVEFFAFGDLLYEALERFRTVQVEQFSRIAQAPVLRSDISLN